MSDGYRKVALSIHGLSKADQKWLLGRLSKADREKVAALLGELREMAVPEETGLLESLMDDPAGEEAGVPPARRQADTASQEIMLIDEQPAARIADALVAEPDWVVAAVLEAHEWSWTQEFLIGLEPARRAEICRLAKRVREAVRSRVRLTLVGHLARVFSVNGSSAAHEDYDRFDRILRSLEKHAVNG